MQVRRIFPLLLIALTTGILFQCDIHQSDLPDESNFIHVYNDADFNNEYYPLDVAETEDGYLILATKMLNSDSTNFDWDYHYPFIVKTDPRGEVEWTYTGSDPYVSPIADLLRVNRRYYYFALHKTGLSPALFEIDPGSQSVSLVSDGAYGENSYALKAIIDSDENILLLVSEKQGTKDSRVYKLSGVNFEPVWSTGFTNSANDGTYIIIPAVLEQLSHHGQQYPYSIKQIRDATGGIGSYLVGCYSNTQLSLNRIAYNGANSSTLITGSRNAVFIASFQQIKDSVLALARCDNGELSLQTDFIYDEDVRTGIEDLNGTYEFREIDGTALVLSEIISFNDKDYLVFAAATLGKQVALFIYNTDDSSIRNIHYIGSTNDIAPVAIRQTSDDAILVLCKTLVTNKYPRIALYKIPLEDIGLEEEGDQE